MENQTESIMVNGFYPKPKHENAPDFVIGKLSIRVDQFREFLGEYLKEHPEEWINIDMKVSKNGKGYAVIDNWEPGQQGASAPQPAPADDKEDLPF